MKVINPVAITDAMLTSSSVPEPATGEVVWVSGGTYALNATCVRTTNVHRSYVCVLAHNSVATFPEVDPTHWLDSGPTLAWAMFDGAVNTQTIATNTLTTVLVPRTINSLAMMELVGSTATITQKDAPGGNAVYSYSQSLDGTLLLDWYMYFFEPFAQLDTVVLTNLLPYMNGELTVTVSGTGTVKCGMLSVGTVYDLGGTQYDVTAGIIDFSAKTTDAYGTTKITKRAYSKRMEAKMMLGVNSVNKVHKLLASIRSTPVVWIGSDITSYSVPLVMFGYYKDFTLQISYPTYSLYTIQIEGLI